jgi:hypothetical protein
LANATRSVDRILELALGKIQTRSTSLSKGGLHVSPPSPLL